jgi:hypothetical protein
VKEGSVRTRLIFVGLTISLILAAAGSFISWGQSSSGNFAPAPFVKSGVLVKNFVVHPGESRKVNLTTAGFRTLLLQANADIRPSEIDGNALAAGFLEVYGFQPKNRIIFPQPLPGLSVGVSGCRTNPRQSAASDVLCGTSTTQLNGLGAVQVQLVNNTDNLESTDENFTVNYFLSR